MSNQLITSFLISVLTHYCNNSNLFDPINNPTTSHNILLFQKLIILQSVIMEQINIRCPIHRKEYVITSCSHVSCMKQPLICPLCPDAHYDHYSQLQPIQEWVNKTSKAIMEGNKFQKQIKETIQLDSVLKWCEDDEMHLRKVEEHCKAQKALIQEDINVVKELFAEKCQQTQLIVEQELEDFLFKYKESFKQCKQTVDETFTLMRNCYPFSNSNNLVMKMQQSTSRELQELTLQLKKITKRNYDNDQVETIRVSADRITEMTYNLPVYQFQEGIEQLCQQLQETLSQHLKSRLSISKPKPSYRSVSPQKVPIKTQENSKSPKNILNFNVSAHSKSLFGGYTDINLKPLKKYQLDFQVSSVEVVSQTLFAMTCSNDPHLRVFDTQQKRIHTLSAHSSPIIQIQKTVENINPLQPSNSVKQSTFMFTLSSDSIIIWTFEQNNQNIPHIFHKYITNNPTSQICYLQDNACIALGDRDGSVEVYNFQSGKIQQQAIRGKHSSQISSIVVLKRNDKFIVGSHDQNISVWRMIYSGTFENTYCESIIQCNSQIQGMSLLIMNPNLILVSTLEGVMKVISLSNQCVVQESESSKQLAIIDFLVIEDQKKGILLLQQKQSIEQVIVMSLAQQSTQIKIWKFQQDQQQEQKVDIALNGTDSLIRSKLQFVQMPQNSQNPLVLIANEANRELLVYEIK
ncbi:hypothetical protein pb186bvf_007297 [Paramecium bursaria]